MSKARPIIFSGTIARAAIIAAMGLTTATVHADEPTSQTPFVKELLSHWATFDSNNDGVIGPDEVNKLVIDRTVTGDEAAAAASLKLIIRLKSAKGREPLPPLTRAFFDAYNEKAMATLHHDGLKHAVEETAGAEGLTEEATKPAEAPANFDRYFVASKKRLAGAAGDAWRTSGYTLDNVHQGPMGDCFFVASATSLSIHRPEYLSHLVQQLPDGSYRATFPNAAPFTFPALTHTQLAISGNTTGDGAWLAVLEQAFGRYRASLKGRSLESDGTESLYTGGDSKVTLTALTGHKIERIPFPKFVEDREAKKETILPQLRETLTKAIADHRAITAGILPPPKEGKDGKTPVKLPPNINANHVYAVVDYDAKTDVVQIWNPHGQSFTPKGEPGLANGYVTEHGRFKLPLAEAYSFYTSFTFETDQPANGKME